MRPASARICSDALSSWATEIARPCLRAFWLDRFLPAAVRGPVLLMELRWLAACRGDAVTIHPSLGRHRQCLVSPLLAVDRCRCAIDPRHATPHPVATIPY